MSANKPNKLADAFSKSTGKPEQLPKTKTPKSNSRAGKRTVITYIDPAGVRELKILAADTERSQQDLLTEAINDFLVKHGKKPLA